MSHKAEYIYIVYYYPTSKTNSFLKQYFDIYHTGLHYYNSVTIYNLVFDKLIQANVFVIYFVIKAYKFKQWKILKFIQYMNKIFARITTKRKFPNHLYL